MSLDGIHIDDAIQIFFEYMNPGSCFANLDWQHFTVNLNATQEATKHFYILERNGWKF